jgi:hypothetical protein
LFQGKSLNINHVCDFTIQFSAGILTIISVCGSQHTELEWRDSDPLDVVYYRFGTWEVKSEFHVHTGKILIFNIFSFSFHNVGMKLMEIFFKICSR